MNVSLPNIDLRDIPRRILPMQGTSAATTLSIAPFLALGRDLSAWLVPMPPRLAFRSELHHSLIAEARRQQAQFALAITPPPATPAFGNGLTDRMTQLLAPVSGERRWAVGAAVGGAVSLGLLAYLLRHRDRTERAA